MTLMNCLKEEPSLKYLTDDLSFKEKHLIGKVQVSTIPKMYIDFSILVIVAKMSIFLNG